MFGLSKLRSTILYSSFSILACISLSYAQDCSAAAPCEIGCCSKFGYCGLGPDFCASDVCVANCDRKSECDPGFGSEWADSSKCPLNVCCSKYGFCGTTEEFCGDKKIKKKTCSKDGTLDRVVGYYESWSARRPCNSFFPEQIPLGVYSIINFAFATIDPQTFEVLPDSSDDISMYSRVTALKKQDPSLRVFIAIGGWTFNDPGPTATTFSDIAGSETNQKAFFKSLIAFLNKYDFDGIDLDWEYPAADDRSGREEDYANFPSFIANLKNSLKQTSGRNGLSITLPASYWYLKHFDLVKLRKSVDFFNIMSYDLHGTWDKGNKWTGELLNPHTNITEIDLALDLLWRNDVDPSMVVMGLAFYARAYTLTDSSCTQPQCTFASGAKKGACSHESGILMNSEIDDIVDDKDLSPELWKDETVKVVHWDDQWLSYDDADTLKLKTDYARSLCLGGVMVWAISHDTKDAKYTKALAQVANRKITSLPSVEGPTYDVKVPHPQCKWTNCQDGCPSGWQLMKREDEHAHDGEWMFDGSGCDGVGIHALCCPSTETLPTCGWWTLPNRGGNCNPECPEGYKEVGSNSQYCDNSYQAACCSLKDSDNNYLRAMELYEGCEWAEAPLCDWGVCTFQGSAWPTELVDSYTGNGGAICNVRSYNPNDRTIDVQERKYCCDTATESRTWSNCEWVKTGLGSAGARCYPNCPSGKTRVALDTWGDDCRTSGARAYCCDADNYDVEQRYSDTIQQFRDAMDEWIKSPTCPRGSGAFSKRSLSTARSPDDISYLLHVRQDQTPIGGGSGSTDKVLTLLVAILAAMYQPLTDMITAERDAWDYGIKQKEQYDVLQSVPLQSFVTDETRYPPFQLEGPQETGERFLCQLDVTAALLARPSGRTILCDADMCTIDGLCFDDFDEDSPYSSSDRGLGVTARRGLEKRDDMGVEFDCIDAANPNGKKISWTKRPWISSGAWDSQNTIYDNGLTHIWEDHCSITRLRQSVLPDGELYATEHIVEVQTMSLFFGSATTDNRCNVDCEFFINFFNNDVVNDAPLPGGFNSQKPSERIMDALGSDENTQNFVLLKTSLNGMKARIWRYLDPISDSSWGRFVADTDNPREALQSIRDAIAVWNYLNHSYVRPKLKGINQTLRSEFKKAQDAYNAATGRNINLLDCWDLWFAEHIDDMVSNTKRWVTNAIADMRRTWAITNNPNDPDYQARSLQVNQHLDRLEQAGLTNGEIHFDTGDL